MPLSDIEIARQAKMQPIENVAAKIGISRDQLLQYGPYKAKLSLEAVKEIGKRKPGKLILVTAINPTPAGEGKTTTTVGLGDGLNAIGKKAVICLREPSLGPCFGVKGGAAGGGYAQIVPMEDINLHFTGDFHAIAAANNLLAAMVDNHVYWGNELGIDVRRVTWKRVLDMNDRALRQITNSLGGPGNGYPARRRLRHRRRLGSDGDLLPRHRPRRPDAPPGQHHRRPARATRSPSAPRTCRPTARWPCC